MATVAEILRDIHRLRRLAKDLQVALEKLPRQLQHRREDVALAEQRLKDAREEVKKLKLQAKEDEISEQSTAGQIERYEGQMNGIISKREYEAFQHEIAHARGKLSSLQDKILNTYTLIEEKEADLPGLEADLARRRQELADFEREGAERKAGLTGELQRALAELAEVENTLPAGDFRVKYQRLLDRHGEDAFSPVKKRTCQACYTEATAQMNNELSQGLLVFCKNCGRILYLDE